VVLNPSVQVDRGYCIPAKDPGQGKEHQKRAQPKVFTIASPSVEIANLQSCAFFHRGVRGALLTDLVAAASALERTVATVSPPALSNTPALALGAF
jgi:hypothetical protein